MSHTLTISVTPQDLAEFKNNRALSPSKIFRSAMILMRHRNEFFNINDIVDYRLVLLEQQEKIQTLQKEIVLRNERIDSLQDVLAQKELTDRRIRCANEPYNSIRVGAIEVKN